MKINEKIYIFYRVIYTGDGRYYYGSHTGGLVYYQKLIQSE